MMFYQMKTKEKLMIVMEKREKIQEVWMIKDHKRKLKTFQNNFVSLLAISTMENHSKLRFQNTFFVQNALGNVVDDEFENELVN